MQTSLPFFTFNSLMQFPLFFNILLFEGKLYPFLHLTCRCKVPSLFDHLICLGLIISLCYIKLVNACEKVKWHVSFQSLSGQINFI